MNIDKVIDRSAPGFNPYSLMSDQGGLSLTVIFCNAFIGLLFAPGNGIYICTYDKQDKANRTYSGRNQCFYHVQLRDKSVVKIRYGASNHRPWLVIRDWTFITANAEVYYSKKLSLMISCKPMVSVLVIFCFILNLV